MGSTGRRRVNIVEDVDGNKIVVISDVIFKGRKNVNWDDVESYLKNYVGDIFKIASTGDYVYIGKDFPDEYAGSKYTHSLKGTLSKAKANASQGIPELIETSDNATYRENNAAKHNQDARYGWFRFNSRFAIPVYNDDGDIYRFNVFHASMLIRHDRNGRLYLYDVIDIKKETSNPFQQ